MTALILGAFWIIAASITALLPLRAQMIPGLSLLASAPVLLLWIGVTHGFWPTAFGTFALLSLFRRPLNYIVRKLLRLPLPLLAPEFQR